MKSRLFFLAFLLFRMPAIQADDLPPIPDQAAQDKAAALVKEIFAKEIARAETAEQKSALVKSLLAQAEATTDDAAARFALYRIAIESAPDALTAMSIIDEVAEHFDFNALSAKSATVVKMSKSARTAEEHKAVAAAADNLIDAYVDKDNFDAALKLGEIAYDAAKKSRDTDLIRVVRARNDDNMKLQQAFAKVQTSLALLETDPTEPTANTTVGKYKCLAKGDWEDGLPLLALGNDPSLKELAIRELKSPTAGEGQMALADGWYDLAQAEAGPTKDRMLHRAAIWYAEAKPNLTGLLKTKVEKRLSELAAITQRYGEQSADVIKSLTLSGDKLIEFFNYSGRVRRYAEDGVEFYRGSGKGPGRAESKMKFRPPIEIHIQAFCLPDGAYDFFINILGNVRLNWGTFANRFTEVKVKSQSNFVRHIKFKANELNDIVFSVDNERKLTITLNETVVYSKVIADDIELEGPLIIYGGQGHTVYKSVTIRKLSPTK